MGLFNDLVMFGRFAAGLRGFFRHPLSPSQALALRRSVHMDRETRFLRLVERGVFQHPRSPYLPLLRAVGCELGDVRKLVQTEGLDQALHVLMERGVYVSFEEFKGRRPIVRAGRTLTVQPEDFANPLRLAQYEGKTSGSRGAGTHVAVDFDLSTYDAAWQDLFLTTYGLRERALSLWRPLPPGLAGLFNVLAHAKLGLPVERWFTHNKASWERDSWKYLVLTHGLIHGARWLGRRLPRPEHVPLEQAVRVARWLARRSRAGAPALLDTNSSSGVRVCRAALDHRLDIRGTFFRLGGEPYTAAKAQIVAATGSRAISHYSMAELGRIGLACAAPVAPDEVHLLTEKFAFLTRPTELAIPGLCVPALVLTTLHPASSLLLLNVATDDFGVLDERDCGCPLQAAGLRLHLHTIRSYEKLNSEGMTFFGSDLFPVIEETLPRRFGGLPTDYQFVETEEEGLPLVSILVSPRVGPVDEAAVVDAVLQALRACPDGDMMVERWQAGRTLRVIRRSAYVTSTAKTLPLHVVSRRSSP